MTDILPTHQGPTEKQPPEATAPPLAAEWQPEEGDGKQLKDANKGDPHTEGEEVMGYASMEPTTLQWPSDKEALMENERERGEGKEMDSRERASMRSDCASLQGGAGGGRESRTESEMELRMREKRKTADGWPDMTMETGPGGERERDGGMELKARQKGSHLEIEMDEVNSMPEEAARVFRPNGMHHGGGGGVPESPREWEDERSPFMGAHGAPANGYYQDWEPEEPMKPGCAGCGRDAWKVFASLCMGALFFPFMVWGGYVFLPFDAPLLETAALRLVYTLRCSVFGVVPIVLGLLVLGISRLRFGALRPHCEGVAEVKEVSVHRRFVDESVTLFVLYFTQLAVLAAYLNHDLLKLVPLLTIIFAMGRLCY
ncbi:transmembrane protein 79 isoform X2 [Engraulis encrasicolus]